VDIKTYLIESNGNYEYCIEYSWWGIKKILLNESLLCLVLCHGLCRKEAQDVKVKTFNSSKDNFVSHKTIVNYKLKFGCCPELSIFQHRTWHL
jgi:hypothetical protein